MSWPEIIAQAEERIRTMKAAAPHFGTDLQFMWACVQRLHEYETEAAAVLAPQMTDASLRARLEALEMDRYLASGELLVAVGPPGSDLARVVSANKLLRDEHELVRAENRLLRNKVRALEDRIRELEGT